MEQKKGPEAAGDRAHVGDIEVVCDLYYITTGESFFKKA